MFLRFLTRLLLSATFLLLGAGCTKKTDPQPAVGTGSYQLATYQHVDGHRESRQVGGEARTVVTSDTGYDYLEVWLTTTPQPASGPETLKLHFHKPLQRPSSAYEFVEMVVYNSIWPKGRAFENEAVTLVAGPDGSFSGTFSGSTTELAGFNVQKDFNLTNGIFTNARP